MQKSYLIAGIGALAAFLACGGDDGGKPSSSSLATTCARICVRLNAASCKGDNPNVCMDTCMSNATSLPSACSAQGNALLSCASKASYVCDADSQGQPAGCDMQTATLVSCIAANVVDGGTPATRDASTGPVLGKDAGTADAALAQHDGGSLDLGQDGGVSVGDGGALSCSVVDSTNTCHVCGATSCCEVIVGCGDDCVALDDCTTDCDNGDPASSDACYGACEDASTSSAIADYNALYECLSDNCSNECF